MPDRPSSRYATRQSDVGRVARRTPTAAVQFARRRGPELNNHELAAELNAAGHRTGTGRPFDPAAVQWLRWRYQIPAPPLFAAGEISVNDLARRLGISIGAVYYWISHGQLTARRGEHGRLGVPFPPDVEHACRERIANSLHLRTPTKITAAGGAV